MAVGFLATGGSAGAGDGHRGGGGHSAAVGEEGALFVCGPDGKPGVETMGSVAV